MNIRTSICRGCSRTISFDGDIFKTRHYCDSAAPGETFSCRELNTKKKNRDKNARVRKQAAALNGGISLRRGDKSLQQKLAGLTVRSYAETAAVMGLTVQAIRALELSALEKIRKGLMPFLGAISGEAKIKQITQPIPSLED